MRRAWGAFGSGLLFGAGLCVSGMIDPRNVVGFLDFAGHWNPSLAAVMVGAVAVHASLLWWLRARRGQRLTAGRMLAAGGPIDARLVGGSAIFGIGWGLAGYCPGPALVALGFGSGRAVAFAGAMVAGALLADLVPAYGAATAGCAAVEGPIESPIESPAAGSTA